MTSHMKTFILRGILAFQIVLKVLLGIPPNSNHLYIEFTVNQPLGPHLQVTKSDLEVSVKTLSQVTKESN